MRYGADKCAEGDMGRRDAFSKTADIAAARELLGAAFRLLFFASRAVLPGERRRR